MHQKSTKTKTAHKHVASVAILLSTLALTPSAAIAADKAAGKTTEDLPSAQADPVVDIELLTWRRFTRPSTNRARPQRSSSTEAQSSAVRRALRVRTTSSPTPQRTLSPESSAMLLWRRLSLTP